MAAGWELSPEMIPVSAGMTDADHMAIIRRIYNDSLIEEPTLACFWLVYQNLKPIGLAHRWACCSIFHNSRILSG